MDIKRIRAKIADFASHPKHVRFDELETLLDNHIKYLFPNYSHHGNPHHAFTVGGSTFNISKPHGGGFVKKRYIEFFLEAMEAVNLYDPEDDHATDVIEPDSTGGNE
jgi:hypothetical protein